MSDGSKGHPKMTAGLDLDDNPRVARRTASVRSLRISSMRRLRDRELGTPSSRGAETAK
jgi:hypothetical protein